MKLMLLLLCSPFFLTGCFETLPTKQPDVVYIVKPCVEQKFERPASFYLMVPEEEKNPNKWVSALLADRLQFDTYMDKLEAQVTKCSNIQ